jgi:hypothetical protein
MPQERQQDAGHPKNHQQSSIEAVSEKRYSANVSRHMKYRNQSQGCFEI